MPFHLLYSQKTDRGKVRRINEDSLWAEVPEDPTTFSRQGALFVVADGLGGMAHGEEASRIAVEEMQHHFAAWNGLSVAAWLHQAAQGVHAKIRSLNEKTSRDDWMATTLTCSHFRGGELTVAHIGDSRLYRLREETLSRLTQDHSVDRHTLTRAVGTDPKLLVDIYEYDLKDEDVYLQCSDGLYAYVDERDLRQVMRGFPPREGCERLVDLANQNGGADNISVQIIRVRE